MAPVATPLSSHNGKTSENRVKDVHMFQSTRVIANFGGRRFVYGDVAQQCSVAEGHDATVEVKHLFEALPFHVGAEGNVTEKAAVVKSDLEWDEGHDESGSVPPCRTASFPKALRGRLGVCGGGRLGVWRGVEGWSWRAVGQNLAGVETFAKLYKLVPMRMKNSNVRNWKHYY